VSQNDLERTIMNDKPYGSAIGNLMYAHVCTRPDTIFIVGVLGRYLSMGHLTMAYGFETLSPGFVW